VKERSPILLALAMLLAPSIAAADVPDGEFVFEFDGGNQIFDLSEIDDCQTVDGVTACLTTEMLPDGKGGHVGTANLDFDGEIEGVSLVGMTAGPAFARIKGSAAGAKAAFGLRTQGELEVGGAPIDAEINTKCKGQVATNGVLLAVCRIKVTFLGFGSLSGVVTFEDTLNGGPWNFTMNVTPIDGKSFEGTGTDSLGYEYEVSGKYSDAKGVSSVKAIGLKGTPSNGAKIQLKNLNEFGDAESKFKVQGYKGGGPVSASP